MTHRVVGVFHSPWDPEFYVYRRPGRQPLAMYRWALWYKANPRSADYMRALFAERYPDGVFVDVAQAPDWRAKLHGADTVVLLYPDAIGLGWYHIESAVRREKAAWAATRVLNGRRRDFLLNCTSRAGLGFRRLAEHSMLGELLALPLFLLLTPILLACDRARGRT